MGEENRRKAPRIPAKVPVKLRPVEGTTPYMISGDSINISERGLYFQMTGPMKPARASSLPSRCRRKSPAAWP